MTKRKISSKEVRARTLVIYELEELISYVHTIAPELKPDQAIVLTAFILDQLPRLFEENPALLNQVKETTAKMKSERRP